MIDTRKAIKLVDLRPEELEPRLELQSLYFGGGINQGNDPGGLGFGGGINQGNDPGGLGFGGGINQGNDPGGLV